MLPRNPRFSRRLLLGAASGWFLASATPVRAAFLHGETLDAAANVISWIAIIVAPLIGIAIFWMVHILPEKIAEKRNHPQAKAIQCLCLLSLVFGGLLWPLAWLWAYSKPVLYRMAYGTDVDETHGHHGKKEAPPAAPATAAVTDEPVTSPKPEPPARSKPRGGKA